MFQREDEPKILHLEARPDRLHDGVTRMPDPELRRMSIETSNLPVLTEGARLAAERERRMTVREVLQIHRRGVFWSLVFLSSIVMEGFDLALLSGFYAFPAFLQEYGEPNGKNDPKTGREKFEIPPSWQTALSAGAMIGQIIGLSFAGVVAQKLGYKKTMTGALSLMTCLIFIPFFAPSREVLLLGEIMQGIPWGVFETMPAAYASEMAPLVLRPYLTTFANLSWIIGQLIAAGTLKGFLKKNVEDSWAYRIPFALQWIWPVPILMCVLVAPESPWWLERRGYTGRTRQSLRQTGTTDSQSLQNTLELMQHTILLEKRKGQDHHGSQQNRSLWRRTRETAESYCECFKGIDRRRTEITCGTWISQSLCGSNLMAFAPVFFQAAGLNAEHAFSMQLGVLTVGALGTVWAWFIMQHLGRRTIYLLGLFGMFVLLLVIGILGCLDQKRDGLPWAIATLLGVYILVYQFSVGPTCYSIVTEIPSTRLRASTVALARICYNLCGILSVVVNPLMLATGGWNWGPKAALLWAGLCACCCTWAYFRLPEPKGRTFGELDILFQRRVPARDFKTTKVDQFSSITLVVKESGGSVAPTPVSTPSITAAILARRQSTTWETAGMAR